MASLKNKKTRIFFETSRLQNDYNINYLRETKIVKKTFPIIFQPKGIICLLWWGGDVTKTTTRSRSRPSWTGETESDGLTKVARSRELDL